MNKMEEKIAQYMDFIFKNAPDTLEAIELKEEIQRNVSDKFHKLINEAQDEEHAFSKAIAGIGNVEELLDEIKLSAEKSSSYPEKEKQKKFESKLENSQENIKKPFSKYRLFLKIKSLVWSFTLMLYLLISFLTGVGILLGLSLSFQVLSFAYWT